LAAVVVVAEMEPLTAAFRADRVAEQTGMVPLARAQEQQDKEILAALVIILRLQRAAAVVAVVPLVEIPWGARLVARVAAAAVLEHHFL
jgi:hypothetical protein